MIVGDQEAQENSVFGQSQHECRGRLSVNFDSNMKQPQLRLLVAPLFLYTVTQVATLGCSLFVLQALNSSAQKIALKNVFNITSPQLFFFALIEKHLNLIVYNTASLVLSRVASVFL